MIQKLHRVSKAIAAMVPGLAVFISDVALQTADVTADGTIVQNEWYALAFAFASGLVTFFAPKNATPI